MQSIKARPVLTACKTEELFTYFEGSTECGQTITLLAQKEQEKIKHGVQVTHCLGNRWIVASKLGYSNGEVIKVFDSLYTPVHKDTGCNTKTPSD